MSEKRITMDIAEYEAAERRSERGHEAKEEAKEILKEVRDLVFSEPDNLKCVVTYASTYDTWYRLRDKLRGTNAADDPFLVTLKSDYDSHLAETITELSDRNDTLTASLRKVSAVAGRAANKLMDRGMDMDMDKIKEIASLRHLLDQREDELKGYKYLSLALLLIASAAIAGLVYQHLT